MLGINTNKTYTFAFVLGVTLAALSGLIVTPLYYVQATVGNTFRIAPLMVVVLGGMGSIKGALVGGASELKRLADSGELKRTLSGG